jgi:hypothetical protein
MRRSLLILFAVVVAGGALGLGSYRLTGHLCSAHFARPTDDLSWLRLEFGLSEAELARIRQLHEGYLPQCRFFCERIAAGKAELQHMLETGTNAPAAVEQKLAEIAAQRARCQAAMLRHFAEVSRAMPPAQGRRYLAEMQRLTLGFHEQVEHSMSGDHPASHGR